MYGLKFSGMEYRTFQTLYYYGIEEHNRNVESWEENIPSIEDTLKNYIIPIW